MRQPLLFLLILISFAHTAPAQSGARTTGPKLVVGVVVDQMRWDYLYRYSDRYAANGLKRILREGFSCENTFIPYTPTYTAPGHASVYTGSVPSLHGIIGNGWYSRALNRSVYCTEDSTVRTVGSTSNAGEMSPRNMWSSTITDEVRLAGNFRGKAIGIALKDRGAILPAGHTANAAYWFDNASGGWITSTWYMDTLPGWVQRFNERRLPDAYMQRGWKTLYPVSSYVQSTEDDKPYEGGLNGDKTFEHMTQEITRNKYEAFRGTPWGNTYTFDMAKAAIEGERLGRSGVTDFLAVSFSSPDYIGHSFGPNSIEVEDTYLRFDREMAEFLQYLDQRIGKGQYLLFLTADHGVAHIPGFAEEHKLPAGLSSSTALRQLLNTALQQEFNRGDLILNVSNYQVYLAHDVIRANKLDRQAIKEAVIRTLVQDSSISRAFDLEEVQSVPLPGKVRNMVVNGYNQKLSGDIQFILMPQWFEGGRTGTTHGVWHPYDSHIPLLWFGWNIRPGKTNRETYMTDIAPTLAALLQVQMPNAAIGDVIEEVVDKRPAVK